MKRCPHRAWFIMAVALWSASVWGATPIEQAQALFDEGRRLLDSGNARDACEKLQESDRLDPDYATKFQLARCYESLGRNASALELFRVVADASHRAGNGRAEQVARERLMKVTRLVARLRLHVRSTTMSLPSLSVRCNERDLDPAQLEAGAPIDSGPNRIVVSAAGRKPWSVQILVPNKPDTLEIEVPDLDVEPPGTASSPASGSAPSKASTIVPQDSGQRAHDAETAVAPNSVDQSSHRAGAGPWLVAGWGGLALGALATGIGATLAWTAKSSYDDAAGSCGVNIGAPTPERCTPEGAETRNDAIARANAGGIVMVTGLTLAGAGAAFLLIGNTSRTAERPRVSAMPSLGGVMIRGAF